MVRRRERTKRGRIDGAQVAGFNTCFSAFSISFAWANGFYPCAFFVILSFHLCTPHHFTFNTISVSSVPLLLPPFLFPRTSPTFPSICFNLQVSFYSQLSFSSICTVPLDLPSLPVSLALGLLICAFYLHAALQYSGGGGLFSWYVHFRDFTVPHNYLHSSHTHLLFLPWLFLMNPISSFFVPAPFTLSPLTHRVFFWRLQIIWHSYYLQQSSSFIFNSFIYFLPISWDRTINQAQTHSSTHLLFFPLLFFAFFLNLCVLSFKYTIYIDVHGLGCTWHIDHWACVCVCASVCLKESEWYSTHTCRHIHMHRCPGVFVMPNTLLTGSAWVWNTNVFRNSLDSWKKL